jgi:hypothetical protein
MLAKSGVMRERIVAPALGLRWLNSSAQSVNLHQWLVPLLRYEKVTQPSAHDSMRWSLIATRKT